MIQCNVQGEGVMVNKGRGYVYSIKYHLVWCVKYRRKIIEGKVEKKLKILLNKIAEDNEFIIEEMETDLDHIHLLIECKPQHYIPDMLKALKGASARLLMKEFGDSLKSQLYGGHMWNPSYFVATVSENTEEQIRNYIESQKIK
jgi:putative transposase